MSKKITVEMLNKFFVAGPGNTPRITCENGLVMSVQVGSYLYCSPRDNYGPWDEAEIGFPSERVEKIMPYIDGDEDDPTGTVYGYVPLDIIVEVINDNGGSTQISGV